MAKAFIGLDHCPYCKSDKTQIADTRHEQAIDESNPDGRLHLRKMR